MVTASPSAAVQLHLVPAGRRLDFPVAPGQYAYVFRRAPHEPWQCVAHNACSPYLDRSPANGVIEYMVHYRDAAGTLVTTTAVVRANPALLPVRIDTTSL
ncbi:hypothetical protein [Hymenobacter sp. CRA2]|uniref:hypothetical protein n=1 Tax=Hymenobacter sp. CRA2 TaxID=1955620 RepID=UPI00098F2952|nr:hypothetical protein [Hymenobacter sp. CRA2]OON66458.1 hypothetical protein B0919_21730 [Hymenobacter sp. CRA2]